jgi:crotonobetainyl-CoA:carnitine CoA-transferase CaiB-like acyl-CoA transferase
VTQLVAQADVLIENYRPGVLARYELDYASVRALNPRIVYCSISGYGQTGAWSNRPAYDHVLQAAVGMMMINGAEGGAPIKTGFPLIDTATAMMAAFAITGALMRRARTGAGANLDLSMAQGALQLLLPTASGAFSGGRNPERTGNAGWTGSPGSDTFACADGWIAIAANTFTQIAKLARAVALEELAQLAERAGGNAPERFARSSEVPGLHGQLAAAIARESSVALEWRLNAAGVPAARVRTLIDFLREAADPSFSGITMQRVTGVDGSAWAPEVRFTAQPEMDSDETESAAGAAHYPGHGEHTREILLALGADDAEIAALAQNGLIRASAPEQPALAA